MSFQQVQIRRHDVAALWAKSKGAKSFAYTLPILESLSRAPAAGYASVLDAAAPNADIDTDSIRLLQDFFLSLVNVRLQDLYRSHLKSVPQPSSQDERLALLSPLENEARSIVNSYDWDWLARWLRLDLIGESAETCLLRLSNFAFEVKRVNFRFTYHCNIACRHCYNSSGPQLKTQRIAVDKMTSIIGQMPGVGVGHLNITGGEPFLYQDDLAAMISAARRANLRGVSIYTNGFWAQSYDKARATLERLAACGFMGGPQDHIKASGGVYHQEFLPFERILYLAAAYRDLFGIPVKADFEVAPGDDDTPKRIKASIEQAKLNDAIILHFRTVSDLGRAKGIDGIAPIVLDSPCLVIDQIVFDPDGSVRPCCGFNNENYGVIVGHLNEHRLELLIKRMQNDGVLQLLQRIPMQDLFSHIGAQARPNGYPSNCSLCQDALGSLRDREPLLARLFGEQEFYPFWFTRPGFNTMVPVVDDGEAD